MPTRSRHSAPSLDSLSAADLAPGPLAIVFAEDRAALVETVARCQAQGFAAILLIRDPALAIPEAPGLRQLDHACRARTDVVAVLNRLHDALAGRWLFFCFNAEFLFFPQCETRSVRDLVAFMEEERRAAIFTLVLDLYSDDLARDPHGVSLAHAHFDASGYYGLPAWADGQALERQVELYGGLGWRFEEHLPWTRRRIDRISLYRAEPGLRMDETFRLNDPERNTVNCAWHRNVTATLASFRVAKALRRNPDSAAAIASFLWPCSRPFAWSSRQLLDLGFMEQGQWF